MSPSHSPGKVLIIAQYFPPAGGVGTLRVTKFVKYLPAAGWRPIVLTIRPDCYPGHIRHDQSLMPDVPPEARVVRTPYRHRRWLLDDGVRWFPAMLPAAMEQAVRERPQVCFVSGGPFFPLVTGPLLKARYGLPYVIDLRDPWRLAEHRGQSRAPRARISSLVSRALEPWVLRGAASVICVSGPMRDRYATAYPALGDDHFRVIPNGFDPEDFASLTPWTYDRYTIVFAGKFRYREAVRDPRPFFRALRRVVEETPEVQFVHIGVKEEEVQRAAQEEGVLGQVRFVGAKPYLETLRRIKGADLALLIGGGLRTEQSAKIFDYLGCGRPILALAPAGGGISEVLEATEAGWLIDPEDEDAIAHRLQSCVRRQSAVRPNPAGLELYARPRLAADLAGLFNQARAKSRP